MNEVVRRFLPPSVHRRFWRGLPKEERMPLFLHGDHHWGADTWDHWISSVPLPVWSKLIILQVINSQKYHFFYITCSDLCQITRLFAQKVYISLYFFEIVWKVGKRSGQKRLYLTIYSLYLKNIFNILC